MSDPGNNTEGVFQEFTNLNDGDPPANTAQVDVLQKALEATGYAEFLQQVPPEEHEGLSRVFKVFHVSNKLFEKERDDRAARQESINAIRHEESLEATADLSDKMSQLISLLSNRFSSPISEVNPAEKERNPFQPIPGVTPLGDELRHAKGKKKSGLEVMQEISREAEQQALKHSKAYLDTVTASTPVMRLGATLPAQEVGNEEEDDSDDSGEDDDDDGVGWVEVDQFKQKDIMKAAKASGTPVRVVDGLAPWEKRVSFLSTSKNQEPKVAVNQEHREKVFSKQPATTASEIPKMSTPSQTQKSTSRIRNWTPEVTNEDRYFDESHLTSENSLSKPGKVKYNTPTSFDGSDKSYLKDLIFFIDRIFAVDVVTYGPNVPNCELNKTTFALSLLSGEPQSWATDLLRREETNGYRLTWKGLRSQLLEYWADPHEEQRAALELEKLTHSGKPGSILTYTMYFNKYATKAGFEGKAARRMYFTKLHRSMKKALTTERDEISTLEQLQQACHRQDLRWQESMDDPKQLTSTVRSSSAMLDKIDKAGEKKVGFASRRDFTRPRRNSVTCYNCKGNHYQNECPELKKKESKLNVMSHEEDNSDAEAAEGATSYESMLSTSSSDSGKAMAA